MLAQRSMYRFAGGIGISDLAFKLFRPGSDGSFSALLPASRNSGCLKNLKGASRIHDSTLMGANSSVGSQFLGNIGMQLSFMKATEVVSTPYAVNSRCFIHSVGKKEIEMERNSRSMNFVRGIIEEDGKSGMSGYQFSRPNVEQNADIVHVKLLRNNTFVTVTDSKGNKKIGASSGSLSGMKGGPKASRYAAEATAEHVGRLARNMGLKSVVMKVNGFTFFKKKKQAILSFREGYTHSRGDQNPVVYIEDTTRLPHNGCRLRKKRRI